jgi:hypothetical protein
MAYLEDLTVCCQNVKGLNSKLKICADRLSNGRNVIIITEIWLHNGVHDDKLFNSDYNYKQGMKKGGGMLIEAKQIIISNNIWLQDDKLEELCVQVKYIFTVHFTPSSRAEICVILRYLKLMNIFKMIT